MTAVEKGLITADQLIEAMSIQIREELYQQRHRPVGQILIELGYLDSRKVRDVYNALGLKTTFLRYLSNYPDLRVAEADSCESEKV